MTVETLNCEGAVTIKLAGRLDSVTAGEFEETVKSVINEDVSSLSVDLAEVDFVSSKGLRVLVSAYKMLNGREMTLLSPNASIMEVLRMSGLLKTFTVKCE